MASKKRQEGRAGGRGATGSGRGSGASPKRGAPARPPAPARERVSSEGVRVTAVKAMSGRAATAIEVELEPDTVRGQTGPFKDVRHVTAKIPRERTGGRGGADWREERLSKISEAAEKPGKKASVRYGATHYGPSDTQRYGVEVDIETDTGVVKAGQRRGGDDDHDADKPPQR